MTILEVSALSEIDAAGNVIVPEDTVNPAAAVNKPDVVIVLFVSVSVPAKVAKVFGPVGNVRVPLFVIVAIVGAVSVLLVKVSVPAKVDNVLVPVGIVTVPLFEIVEITGVVNVLFVKVSVPAKVASVFGPVGNVSVPLFVIVAIVGAVNVLLVNVCVPTKVAILEESAASAIDAAGNVTVPAEIAKPLPDVNLPFKATLPFNETSPTTNNLPPIETSDPTYKRLFNDVSPMV